MKRENEIWSLGRKKYNLLVLLQYKLKHALFFISLHKYPHLNFGVLKAETIASKADEAQRQ
jgi:hypothetical protein